MVSKRQILRTTYWVCIATVALLIITKSGLIFNFTDQNLPRNHLLRFGGNLARNISRKLHDSNRGKTISKPDNFDIQALVILDPYENENFADPAPLTLNLSAYFYINSGKSCANPTYKFAFVKTHKCASDTLAAHFMRLAEEKGLEMPLPIGAWNLNWPRTPGGFYKSRKPSDRFDMTALHMMYHPQIWDEIMEPGYKSISIIRKPFAQFKSFFNYFGMPKKMMQDFEIPYNESLEVYLDNPYKYYKAFARPMFKNTMMYDFGFRTGIDDPKMYVQKLLDKFSLVMISDYFDESLIVLRHELCWSLKDILIRTKNVARRYLSGPKTGDDFLKESNLEKKHQEWSPADYILYGTFNKILWEKIARIPNFSQELEDFRNVTQLMRRRCEVVSNHGSPNLLIPKNKFHDSFVIDQHFCSRTRLTVIKYIDRLKKQRYTSNSAKYARKSTRTGRSVLFRGQT